MNYLTGPIPNHQYVYVDSALTHKEPVGFIPAVWFGLVSYPGRLWGCTVMLECGAVYRNIPLHALATRKEDVLPWKEQQACTWDCYGYGWSACVYPYLHSLECSIRTRLGDIDNCEYLFSVSPVGDGFSACPEQSKEFTFVKCETQGRFAAQPTDKTLFVDRSFTVGSGWPKGLKRQECVHSCEGAEVTSGSKGVCRSVLCGFDCDCDCAEKAAYGEPPLKKAMEELAALNKVSKSVRDVMAEEKPFNPDLGMYRG